MMETCTALLGLLNMRRKKMSPWGLFRRIALFPQNLESFIKLHHHLHKTGLCLQITQAISIKRILVFTHSVVQAPHLREILIAFCFTNKYFTLVEHFFKTLFIFPFNL